MCILQKDVEKGNSSGYVDEKEIVRLVKPGSHISQTVGDHHR